MDAGGRSAWMRDTVRPMPEDPAVLSLASFQRMWHTGCGRADGEVFLFGGSSKCVFEEQEVGNWEVSPNRRLHASLDLNTRKSHDDLSRHSSVVASVRKSCSLS